MDKHFLTQKDLYDILPFGKTKINQLIKSGCIPLVKIGKDYVTTMKLLDEWIESNVNSEVFYD